MCFLFRLTNIELVNPDGNSLPFALQNVICILLLEITKFLRETYQYMPTKINHAIPVTKTEIYRDPGSKIAREIRTNFTNENVSVQMNSGNAHSVAYSTKGEVPTATINYKRPSTDNESINNMSGGPDTTENAKHIHFAVTEPTKDDRGSLHSLKIHSPTADAAPVTTVPPVVVPNPVSQNPEPLRVGKANSTKASFRRSSLKYRADRLNRSNTIANNGHYRRKSSHDTNESIQENEEVPEHVSIEAASNATATGYMQTTFIYPNDENPNPNLLNQASSDFTSQINETCEVDEVDFNRCYPWIKVEIIFVVLLKC